jgi:hypothetical protein
MAKKPYKKLLGNRVYVELPTVPKTNVMIDEATRQALEEENMKKMDKLTVYDVGDSVSIVKPGDVVLIDATKMKAQGGGFIQDFNNIRVLLISPFDIVHVW